MPNLSEIGPSCAGTKDHTSYHLPLQRAPPLRHHLAASTGQDHPGAHNDGCGHQVRGCSSPTKGDISRIPPGGGAWLDQGVRAPTYLVR